jgi:cytochrome P450
MHVTSPLGEQLLSPDFTYDPYPAFARLRDLGPVWFEPWQAWIISRHADVKQVLRLDGRDYTATGRVTRLLDQLPDDIRGRYLPLEEHFRSGLLHSDPPDHTRMRRIVGPSLTSRAAHSTTRCGGSFASVEWLRRRRRTS